MKEWQVIPLEQLWGSFFVYSPEFKSHMRQFNNWYDLFGSYGGFRDLVMVVLSIPALAVNKKLRNGAMIRQLFFWRDFEVVKNIQFSFKDKFQEFIPSCLRKYPSQKLYNIGTEKLED